MLKPSNKKLIYGTELILKKNKVLFLLKNKRLNFFLNFINKLLVFHLAQLKFVQSFLITSRHLLLFLLVLVYIIWKTTNWKNLI